MKRGAIFAMLLAIAPGAATLAADRLAAVTASGELRVCTWPHLHGISARGPDSAELVGIDADLARELAREIGVPARFVHTRPDAIVDALLADRCDIAMSGIAVLPELQAAVRFARPHLRTGYYAIVAKTGSAIAGWRDLDRIGHVIGVETGSPEESLLRGQLQHARVAATSGDPMRELDAGRIDARVASYPSARSLAEMHEWVRLVAPENTRAPTPLAYAVRPGDAAWLARVDRFVADIKRDGRLAATARRHGLDALVVRN